MAQKIICSNCRYIIYHGDDLVYPKDVLSKYNYRCPNCGKPLKLDPDRIEIRKAQSSFE